jgi:sulfoxide reductase heme-binding subunit YedZ
VESAVSEEDKKVAKRVRRTWPLVLAGLVALVLVGGLIALQPFVTPLFWVIRTCALLGYLSIFAAIVISAYMRQMVRTFGRPFVQVHHMLSVTGLVLVTLHPLAVALSFGRLGVFVPVLGSWVEFLRWGGPPAWYLIGIASLVALLRTSLRQQWRTIHLLNYVAFVLATVHAILLGSDFRSVVMEALGIMLALVVVTTFIQKRRQQRQLRQRRLQARRP